MVELSRTRWVVLNGNMIKVSDLPDEYKQALGNRCVRNRLKAWDSF
ncbi:hypothetical protein CLFS41_07370 [Clostridium sp. FS41]|nr:hypothetical protein CLFS41_07370 [Clostridium sp. FS41]